MYSLRLADVIGPWDDSHRMWKYTQWARRIKEKGEKDEIPVLGYEEKDITTKISFTYSEDVV